MFISQLEFSSMPLVILEEDKEESSGKFNTGVLLSSISKNVALEDNMERGIVRVCMIYMIES